MSRIHTAKLFKNGASQAVRLPAEFRFDGDEVFVSRDERTGDVILSKRPAAQSWDDFFKLLAATEIPPEFMAERPLNVLAPERKLFSEDDK